MIDRGTRKGGGRATEWRPNPATPGELVAELPLLRHFEQDASRTSEGDIAKVVVCDPDPDAHIARIREYADAGYDQVVVHQPGRDQGVLRAAGAPEVGVGPEITTTEVPALDEAVGRAGRPVYIRWLSEKD